MRAGDPARGRANRTVQPKIRVDPKNGTMTTDRTTPPTPPEDNQLIAERREKLKALRELAKAAGTAAFPNDFKPQHRAADLVARFGTLTNDELEPQAIAVSVAGRMMLKRTMGKAAFCALQDATSRIQLRVAIDNVGAEVYEQFKHWDLGDILGAEGTLFITKTGELTIKVTTDRKSVV